MPSVYLYRYFHDPQPDNRIVLDDISTFISEIERSLKGGINRACSFNFIFRTDVFRFLFGGKEKACPHKLGKFYNEEDFDETYFPSGWFKCCDRLGDGCRVRFRVRMYSKVKWSPLAYTIDPGTNKVVPKKRSFKELCYVWISKERH